MSVGKPSSKKPAIKKPERGKPEISVEHAYRTTIDMASIIQKIRSDVEKGTVKYFTPYILAQAMNIKISDARRALKEASKLGILRLYSRGRRSPVYVSMR